MRKVVPGVAVGAAAGVLLMAGTLAAQEQLSFDFESGDLSGLLCSGNCPQATTTVARSGVFAMTSLVDRASNENKYRTEGIISDGNGRPRYAPFQEDAWYAFSIYVPEAESLPLTQIVAQWPTIPNADLGEPSLTPPAFLAALNGRFKFVSRWDTRLITPENADGKRTLEGREDFNLGPYTPGTWTDFVVHARWSIEDNGLLEVWKDGEKVVTREGPTTINDPEAPYFKVGLYLPANRCVAGEECATADLPRQRRFYHDDVRVAFGEEHRDAFLPKPEIPAAVCDLVGPESALPQGFGAPYDVFSQSREMLLSVTCSSEQALLTVGAGKPMQYIYHLAYTWQNEAWRPFELAGDELIGGAWYAGTAQAALPHRARKLTTNNYVVAYVCTWDAPTENAAGAWKCGCRDAACTQRYWQVQVFRPQ